MSKKASGLYVKMFSGSGDDLYVDWHFIQVVCDNGTARMQVQETPLGSLYNKPAGYYVYDGNTYTYFTHSSVNPNISAMTPNMRRAVEFMHSMAAKNIDILDVNVLELYGFYKKG